MVSAALTPASVQASGRLTATVITIGSVGQVQLYLGSGLPNAPAPITFALIQTGDGTWRGSGLAPSVGGQYHYSVGLFWRGRRTVIDNDSWNVQVMGGGGSSGQAQPLPADVPLAPPFSYGNPVPVVFSALGTSIQGSEITSTTRTDVAPTVVVQWYEVKLPRAGWTVDPSTEPAAGATTLNMVATKAGASGTRVVIVQYAASTIHIFYGTAA